MIIDFSQFTKSLSYAIDYAEKALLDVMPYHGMRVAVMTNRMAEYLGLEKEIIYSLTQAAMLHDCALPEYLIDEFSGNGQPTNEIDMAAHCIAGENMMKKLPLYNRVRGAVLYHHERADGNGALKMSLNETPIYAQLIHMADIIDVNFSLYYYDINRYDRMCTWIRENSGTIFSEKCAEAFLQSVDLKMLEAIAGENVKELYNKILPKRLIEVSVELLREVVSIFAEITDYKSNFTWSHSMGVAEKAEKIGRYYDLSDEECDKLFISGALHDIGKLLISNGILEKPVRLSPEEYKEIQNHAIGTWDLLHNIFGMEDIALWASLHHEKLDGSGYPFGYRGDKLDRNSRLMACLDIYQALVEKRPYKSSMSHKDAMEILRKMGNAGQLDSGIVEDIDSCFSREETAHVYQEEEEEKAKYLCPICGYIFKGDLPDDFICPGCDQPGSIFKRI